MATTTTATTSSLLVRVVMMVMVVMVAVPSVSGFPTGAPSFVCKSMRPLHPYTPQPNTTFPVRVSFFPDTAMPGDTIDVFVSVKNRSDIFRGMLVTAHEATSPDILVPGFIRTNTTHFKLLDCMSLGSKAPGSALTHTERLLTQRASFRWKIPTQASEGSTYVLRFTIVHNVSKYWVGVGHNVKVGPPKTRPTPPTVEIRPPIGGNTPRMTQTPNTGSGAIKPGSAPSQITPPGSGRGSSTTGSISQTGRGMSQNTNSGTTRVSTSNGQQSRPGDNGRPPAAAIQPLPQTPTTGQRNRPGPSPTVQSPSQTATKTPEGGNRNAGQTGLSPLNGQPPLPQPPQTTDNKNKQPSVSGTSGTGGASQISGTGMSQNGDSNMAATGLSNLNAAGQQSHSGSDQRPTTPSVVEWPFERTNQVAGVQNPRDSSTQRVNSLPEGQARERIGGTNRGRGIEESNSENGGMKAWLSGWFGQ